MTGSSKLKLFLAACGVVCLGTTNGWAAFPDKTVHIYCGFAPGGGADLMARLVATKLSEKWGQPVVVENKPGADGTIAEDITAHSPPDGYSLVMVTPSHTVTPSLRKLNYDAINGFAGISLLASQPDVFVIASSFPPKTLKEFIALAKTKPGQFNYGSGGLGLPNFLEMELFKQKTGTNLVNVIYGGVSPTLAALLGNEIQATIEPVSTILDQVKAGKMRALAISTAERNPLMPDTPTFKEAGDLTGFEKGGIWYSMLAPAGTPRDIMSKLHDDMIEAIKSPDMQKNMANQGLLTIGSSSADVDALIRSEYAKWGALLKTIDLKQ